MEILNISEEILVDETIQEYEFHEYEPITCANLNNNGAEIRINIETQDIFTHPSESYLLVEGRLTKNDGTAYENANMISLIKNINYKLSGQVIESLNEPGVSTTMFGLLVYPDDFSKSHGLNQLWYKDTTAEPRQKILDLPLDKAILFKNPR